jgi:predicted PolB exonuclease-like 3'-5' exonuclease
MFNKEQISKYLYLDIETVPSYRSLSDLKKENDRLYKLWKRRESYYRMNYEDCKNESDDLIYLSKAGLEAEFSRIVCVSFGSFTDEMEKKFISFFGNDEIDILQKSHKILNNASLKNWRLCGHNIKNFDVPFLGKRMVYNGINPPNNIKVWDKKPWEIQFTDTSEILSFGSWSQQKYLSLDLLSHSLNITSSKEKMDGSKVGHHFWELEDYQGIKEYCELDVKSVMDIMNKICFDN